MSFSTTTQDEFLALIKRWQTLQDRDAWGAIVTSLTPWVSEALLSCGIQSSDVDDMCADVLSRVMDKLHLYKPEMTKFTTWVCNVARNFAIDTMKRRTPTLTEIDTIAHLISHNEEVSTHILDADEVEFVTSYVAFRVPVNAVHEIGGLFFEHAGCPSGPAIVSTGEVLKRYHVAWQAHGTLSEVTAFLFALLRLAKSRQSDWNSAETVLGTYVASTPLRLIKTLLGPSAAAALVFMFGGCTIRLPTMTELTALTRRRTKRVSSRSDR